MLRHILIILIILVTFSESIKFELQARPAGTIDHNQLCFNQYIGKDVQVAGTINVPVVQNQKLEVKVKQVIVIEKGQCLYYI